jgi:hypothetical protein
MFRMIFCVTFLVSVGCRSAIAEAELPGQADPVTTVATKANAQTAPASPKSRFSGAYTALTGGYDFSISQTEYQRLFTPYPLSAFDAIKGGKAGGLVGYNAVSGPILIGFEARAQYAFGEDSYSSFSKFAQSLPLFAGSCFGGCLPNGVSMGDFALLQEVNYSERVSRPFSGDLSLRAGAIFDDWLIYGRAGVGAEYSKKVVVSDQSNNLT